MRSIMKKRRRSLLSLLPPSASRMPRSTVRRLRPTVMRALRGQYPVVTLPAPAWAHRGANSNRLKRAAHSPTRGLVPEQAQVPAEIRSPRRAA